MDTPIVIERIYDAPLYKVWQALTNTAAMKEWYFPQLKKFVPTVGFQFEFTDDGHQYKKEWIVTQVVENQKFAHTWQYKGFDGCAEVIFEISGEGDKTRLKLTQTGLESFPPDPHFARKRFEWGWDLILNKNLNKYLALH